MIAPEIDRIRENLETSLKALTKSSLTEQLDSKKVLVFEMMSLETFIAFTCN